MKSKKSLFAALAKISPINFGDAPKTGLKTVGISNETYGRSSMIYIRCSSPEHRASIINALVADGFKASHTYGAEFKTVAVQVSYFKGWHWNE